MSKLNKEKILALSYAFISYIFRNAEVKAKIKRIFLFGSVARGDFDEESDIDIFIDVEKKDEAAVTKICNNALKNFYSIEGKKWEYKGITNKINTKIGDVNEWQLKKSIEREAITLFSQTSASNLTKYLLFTIEPIKQTKKRIFISRKLFGRKEKNYSDKGMTDKYAGKILSPRVFIIPSESLQELTSFLAKQKVMFSFEEIWK